MKIKLIPNGNGWRADPAWLPGTPPNGWGKTREEAVGDLFLRLAREGARGFEFEETPSPRRTLRDLAGDYYLHPDDAEESRLRSLVEGVFGLLKEDRFSAQDVHAGHDEVIRYSTGDDAIFNGDKNESLPDPGNLLGIQFLGPDTRP